MTRLDFGAGRSRRAVGLCVWWLSGLAAVALTLAGCDTSPLRRAKAEEETESQHYGVETVGDKTTVGNAEPAPIGGVGLVEGLEGTGGDCNHDNYRQMLAVDLRKAGVRNVPELLKSPECALVIVEGFLMPGASKGDLLDIEVRLPPGSKATSLRGGRLTKCYLYNYDFAHRLSPDYQGAPGMLKGHKLAVAGGPVLVGSGDGELARLRSGRVWAGAKALQHMPLSLIMNQDSQRAALTNAISERVNALFNAHDPGSRVAIAGDNKAVALKVPPQYKNNVPRFLRVVRAIPLVESRGDDDKAAERRPYARVLADDLKNPTRTVVAALRLEALGQGSIATLKKGMADGHPLVRFASAEALAYLGQPSCADALYRSVVEHPILRAYALTAMASLTEAACRMKLRDLALSDFDDETRYGAFRSLRANDETDPVVQGECLGDSFWLHKVGPKASPMVHVSTTKRAEVVLFGEGARLVAPFSLMMGEFTVTAHQGDVLCTVSRFAANGATARRQCAMELDVVLRQVASLGGQYAEAITLLQEADTQKRLSCRLRVDAMPRAVDVSELAASGNEVAGR